MSASKLRQELLVDPLGRNYADMTDAVAAADLADARRRPLPKRGSISRDQFFNDLLDLGEFDALQSRAKVDPATGDRNNDHRRAVQLEMVMKLDTISLTTGSNSFVSLRRIFTASDSPLTRAAIQAYRNRTTSRFDELGISLSVRDADGVAACRMVQP